MSLFLDEAYGQPKAIRDTVASYFEVRDGLKPVLEDAKKGKFRRIVMTGMGNSYYALLPSWIRLNKAGFNVQMVETSELLHYMVDILEESLLVIVSRSGETVEVVRLLDAAPSSVFTLAITDNPSSTLASRSKLTIPTKAGEEHLAASKSHLALLTALHLLSADLAGVDLESERRKLLEAADIVEDYQRRGLDEAKPMGERLSECSSLVIVSRGPTVSSAYTGALIMKEMAKIHCEGYSAAQFRHGPMEIVNPKVGVIVMAGPAETRGLNVKMASETAKLGAPTILIDYGEAEGCEGCMVIKVGAPPDGYVYPLIELPPIYMITYHLALKRGAPLKFVKTGKVTLVE